MGKTRNFYKKMMGDGADEIIVEEVEIQLKEDHNFTDDDIEHLASECYLGSYECLRDYIERNGDRILTRDQYGNWHVFDTGSLKYI